MTPAAQPRYAFAHAALDRASDVRDRDEDVAAHWSDPTSALIAIRRDGRVLVDGAGMRLRRLATEEFAREHASFLGRDGAGPLFCASVDEQRAAELAREGDRYVDLRSAAGELPAPESSIAAFARSLLHWQSRKRYCGRCGAATALLAAGHRALCTNTDCAQEYFPRTDPAIIVLVTDGERCLLGRQASWPAHRFSTLAGFVEPGETLEQAVAREVEEESGVRIGACRYLASQPWPFPAALMLGFEAQAASSEIATGSELAEARWFHHADMAGAIARGELGVSPALSIAYFLIDRWYHERTGEHLQPGATTMARG